jgi:hypothetical protein
MKKFIFFIIFLSFLLISCKKENNNNNNLLFFLLFGLSQKSGITFSGNFEGTSSSISRNAKGIPEGITDVLAISTNNHYHRSKIDSNGNFSININKGYNYLFIFIDSSNNVKGTYKLDSLALNSVPTHYASSSINGGSIANNGSKTYVPNKNFNVNEFLNQAGSLDVSEIGVVASASKQILALTNIDTDGNGVIDLEEDLFIRINFTQQWDYANSNAFSMNNVNNQYFNLLTLKQNPPDGFFTFFSIEQSKAQTSSINITYPIPSNCTDSANGSKSENFRPGGGLVPDGKGGKLTKSFYFNYNYNCQDTSKNKIPGTGTYKFVDGSKTYTFNNLEAYLIETNETFLVPTIKFNVSNDIISSIEYKFQRVSATKAEDATDREVNIVHGSSPWNAGIICRDSVQEVPWTFSCYIPYTKASGTIDRCNNDPNVANVKLTTPVGSNFSRYHDCYFYTIDSFGNHLGFGLH